MLYCDKYMTPKSLNEAFDAIEANSDNYQLVAGGTDILPSALWGPGQDIKHSVLIDVSQIPELLEITLQDGRVSIGANTKIQQFLTDPLLLSELPCMQRCAIWFADQQIREQATIGGNLVNASPCADTVPPMIAMDATLTLASRKSGEIITREVPLDKFILGPGSNTLVQGEILTCINCLPSQQYGSSFKKVGTRRSLTIAVANAVFLVKVDETRQKFSRVRMAFGGIGPTPQRLRDLESQLVGKKLSLETIKRVSEKIPADMVGSRSRVEYRQEVVRNFIVAGLVEALADIGLYVDERGVSEEVSYV